MPVALQGRKEFPSSSSVQVLKRTGQGEFSAECGTAGWEGGEEDSLVKVCPLSVAYQTRERVWRAFQLKKRRAVGG